ncbi:MAG: VCBS repeat-containing protein [Planctomycetaceae bacterium]
MPPHLPSRLFPPSVTSSRRRRRPATGTTPAAIERLEDRTLLAGMWSDPFTQLKVTSATGEYYGSTGGDVAVAADGHYVVAWHGVNFRRFGANGTPMDAADRFVAIGSNPSIGVAADGSFVIAYQAFDSTTSRSVVRFSRFAADGTLLQHSSSLGEPTKDGSRPSLAVANDGRFVMTWIESSSEGGADLVYQVFNADGSPTTARADVANDPADESDPEVAVNPVTGEFTIVYVSEAGGTPDVWRNVYRPDGLLLDARQVHAASALVQDQPAVAMNAAGDVYFAWREVDDAAGIYRIRLGSENLYGIPSLLPAETTVRESDHFVFAPSIGSAQRRGLLVLAWSDHADEQGNPSVHLATKRFDLASNPAGEDIEYAEAAFDTAFIELTATSMNARGDYVLANTHEDFVFRMNTATRTSVDFHHYQPFDQIGAFEAGVWSLDLNANGVFDAGDTRFVYGLAGDRPVTGDWNGDGLTEIGVFRDGWWYLDLNGDRQFDSADVVAHYGSYGDTPVVGDWDGDGRDDVGVFRGGRWYRDFNRTFSFDAADPIHHFGSPGDIPIVGDPDNRGLPTMIVFRGGTWSVDLNRNGVWDQNDVAYGFGSPGDQPLAGNWQSPDVLDRSGVDQLAVVRNGTWYLDWDEDFTYEASDGRTTFEPTASYAVRGAWSLVVVKNLAVLPQRGEIAVFRDGAWTLDANGNGRFGASTDFGFQFGSPDDTPVAGDWDGDGDDEAGVFRGGWWYLDLDGNMSFDASDAAFEFGGAEDAPVVGDWDGDGIDEVGVFRDGVWTLDLDGDRTIDAADAVFNFGQAGDVAVTGDWNGDGRDEVGVFRGGTWILDHDGDRSQGPSDRTIAYGLAGDQAVVGDWNGDGFTDVGVVRDAKWYLDGDGSGKFDALDWVFSYGLASDLALAGLWDMPV